MTGELQRVILPRRLHDELIDYGRASPTVEVCGLLGGRGARLLRFYPVHNIADDPARAFLLEAEGQIDAMRAMRNAGESLRGIFHSHPDGPAEPSDTDLALAAYPDVYYLVLSLRETKPLLAAFYYDGREFQPASLQMD